MDGRSFYSLFKLYFFGFILSTVFFSLLIVVLHPFGLSTVTWNGQEVTGYAAYVLPFVLSLIVSIVFSLILAFFASIGYKIIYALKRRSY